jgi:isocitrate/isopropylmalate dehydrogenase
MINFAVLPGDGIGREVLAGPLAILELLANLGYLDFSGPWPVGASAFMATGEGLPDTTLGACERADAILFGAVGDHPGFDGSRYRPELALLRLREHFDLRVSVRQVWHGDRPPFTIIRNLLGGAYGLAGTRQESDGRRPASDLICLGPEQIEAVVRLACQHAAAAHLPLVSVDKANLLATSRLWRQVAARVAEREGVTVRHALVDQYAFELARRGLPEAVLVTEGLFGDILSDLAAARAGSIALCSSASIHPGAPVRGRCVGLFEPVHGTAPDITGQGIANPSGAYLALAAALEWFADCQPLAPIVRRALAQALAEGPLTPDISPPGAATSGTADFARHVNRVFRTLLEDRS